MPDLLTLLHCKECNRSCFAMRRHLKMNVKLTHRMKNEELSVKIFLAKILTRQYVHCTSCQGSWCTDVTSGPPTEGHPCRWLPDEPKGQDKVTISSCRRPNPEESRGKKTATAAAAGVTGGAAVGAAGRWPSWASASRAGRCLLFLNDAMF